jgi:hypothetical protein
MGKAVTEYTGRSAVCFLAFSLNLPCSRRATFASNSSTWSQDEFDQISGCPQTYGRPVTSAPHSCTAFRGRGEAADRSAKGSHRVDAHRTWSGDHDLGGSPLCSLVKSPSLRAEACGKNLESPDIRQGWLLRTRVQPSLAGLSRFAVMTQDCVLGYFQPSLRDSTGTKTGKLDPKASARKASCKAPWSPPKGRG